METKIIDWLLPWRARRIILDLRKKEAEAKRQMASVQRFLTIRHGLDLLPRITLKKPIER